MSYIQQSLIKDEQIVYQAKVSKWSQIRNIVFAIICFALATQYLILAVLGIFFIVTAFLNIWTTELALTNKRVIAKFGFIQRHTVEINLAKVEGLSVGQGVIGRIFNFGTVVVHGTGGSRAPIPFIDNPLQFRKETNEYLDSNTVS